MKLVGLIALTSLASLNASCSSVECGPGTFSSGKDCVGYDPNDKTPPVTSILPAGGRTRDPIPALVMLTTDEPATIYYTVDGTDPDPAASTGESSPVTIVGVTQGMTVKYMAVDRAGNKAAVASATYDSDTVAPGPVSGITVTLNGTTPHITWTNPTDADYAGTVLARVVDNIDVAPTPGQKLAAGAALSPSLQVVSVGTGTSFDDTARPPGPVRYVAWAFDDLDNYSNGRAAQTNIPLGSLAAQLTFNTADSTLAIVTPPANLDLSATTATLVGTTLTVTLSVKNATTQYFQNPKIEIVSTTNGTFTTPDGTADGRPFKTLGPGMLAPAATKTATLTFTNVTGTVTMNLTFASHPTMIALVGYRNEQEHIDLGSGLGLPNLHATARGPNDRTNGRVRPGVLVGGRYADMPTTHGSIEQFDLVTRTKTGSINFSTGDRTNVQWLISTGGELLAMIKYAGKRQSGMIELVRLDEGLHELGRVKLPYSDDRGFTLPAISADRKTLAMPVLGGILLLDIATLTPIDPVPSSPIVDLLTTGFNDRVHALAFFNGTDGIVAISRLNGRAVIIKRANGTYTSTTYQDASTNAKGYSAVAGPDGRVWMAFASGLRAYDPATDAVTPITGYTSIPQGVAVVEGQLWAIRSDRVNLDQISTTGAVQRTINIPTTTTSYNGAYGHTLDSLR